jgi:DNA-directed RNA polymerase beta' subunit
MKVDIVDLNKFIKVNDIQEVTNPIPFDSGRYPTDDGVLSYKIFGISGSYDRKTIFGYIDLKKHFLHPLMYKLLTRMDQKLTRVINGTGYFVINDNGELIEDNMNGETGISWLYKNFDKLYYSRNSSIKRGRKIDLLENMTKDEIFCNKWLVIPAHLRDVNINNIKHGKLSKDELNDKYNKLIGLCQSSSSEFDFMGMITEFNIQKCLVDIYDYLTGYLAGKKGLIHANLLGKVERFAQVKLS